MIKSHSTFILLSLVITTVLYINLRNPAPYVPEESREYAYYAGLAYCGKKCLEAWNCQGGKDLIHFGEVTHVNNLLTVASAYVGYEKQKNQIIVSFRGSANARNWI